MESAVKVTQQRLGKFRLAKLPTRSYNHRKNRLLLVQFKNFWYEVYDVFGFLCCYHYHMFVTRSG